MTAFMSDWIFASICLAIGWWFGRRQGKCKPEHDELVLKVKKLKRVWNELKSEWDNPIPDYGLRVSYKKQLESYIVDIGKILKIKGGR